MARVNAKSFAAENITYVHLLVSMKIRKHFTYFQSLEDRHFGTQPDFQSVTKFI